MTGIDVDVTDRVGTITISNPDKRNALAPSFLPDLRSAFDELAAEVRCLVVTGAGDRAFSSGFDLSAVGEGSFHEDHEPAYEETLNGLAAFPYPTVAKVNGDAIGGGFDLSLSCDLRVAAESARFGVPTAKVGLVYPERALRQMVRVLGPGVTKELLFTAEPIGASRAAEVGLVNAVVDAEELDTYTADLATTIAGHAPRTLSVSKRIVETLLDADRPSRTELEHIERLRTEVFESEDFQEGLAAIAEGRDPEFTGT